jgi:hypothetical protein
VDEDVDVDVDMGTDTGGAGESVKDPLDGIADANAGGRAYSSVHLRAVWSCCMRFLTYSVAIEGTAHSKPLFKNRM